MEPPVKARLAPIPAQDNGAIIEGAYRYLLWRTWNAALPRALWILLNPSTADERIDDRTLRRCRGFTASWRFGGLEVVNLFALRTPYPRDLYKAADPVGAANDRHIIAAAKRATCIVLAWGSSWRVPSARSGRDCFVSVAYHARAMLPWRSPVRFSAPPTLCCRKQTAHSLCVWRTLNAYQAL